MNSTGIASVRSPAAAPALPFGSIGHRDDPDFGVVLQTRFLKPAIMWMLGQNGQTIVPSNTPIVTEVQYASCWWGIALYLEGFLNAHRMSGLFEETERRILAGQCVQLVDALLEHQQGNGSWDNAVWDTSVICHALISLSHALRLGRVEVDASRKLDHRIKGQVRAALGWLFGEAQQWDLLRHGVGADDLAVLLSLACLMERTGHDGLPADNTVVGSFRLADSKHEFHADVRSLIVYLSERILEAAVKTKSSDSLSELSYTNWGPHFSTGVVVYALAEAVELLEPPMRDKCIEGLVGAIRQIEADQDEGRWGLPNSTSLVLQGYLMACRAISKLEGAHGLSVQPIPHIVFSALRWLADDKQRFADGSLMHTFTHTSYFVMLLEYLILESNLDLLRCTVPQVYDYVLWDSQLSASRDRGERLVLSAEIIHLSGRMSYYQRLYNGATNVLRVLFAGSAFAVFIDIALEAGWISTSPGPISVHDPQTLLAACGVFASIISALWLFSRRWLR